MSKLQYTRPSGGEAQQPIRLTTGVYGAVLQRYSVRDYPDYNNKSLMVEKVSFGLVVLTDAGDRPLPQNSRASIMAANKMFFNAETGIKSKLFEILTAFYSGKYTVEQLSEMDPDDLPDMDNLVGLPVQIMVELAIKPDKNGIFHNNVKSMFPATPSFKTYVRGIYKTFEFKNDEKSGDKYLASPQPEYEVTGEAPSANVAPVEDEDDSAYDKIPF